ncbi:MAG: aldolase/citrate lyase family protein, partial [Gemmatimonadota bacterium]
TADPDVAATAAAAGVDRIFVDLEERGKALRQAGRDTVISGHTLEDVSRVRERVPAGSLLVRINPPHAGTAEEVESALAAGADILMLPMFESVGEVVSTAACIGGRVAFVPLVETAAALRAVPDVVAVPGVSELYIGLNDLHFSLGRDFLFEPLAEGLLDAVAAACAQAGVPFGFGGVARVGQGDLPAEWILGEHVRLGSTAVILSRAFTHGADGGHIPGDGSALRRELDRLREVEAELRRRTPQEVSGNRRRLVRRVNELARAARPSPG